MAAFSCSKLATILLDCYAQQRWWEICVLNPLPVSQADWSFENQEVYLSLRSRRLRGKGCALLTRLRAVFGVLFVTCVI